MTTTSPSIKYNVLPWNEKYRPQTLNDVCGQHDIIELFTKILEHNQPMHLLMYGPPGTGKTSTIMSFCHQIYDTHMFNHCVLNINASYDRGIDMVRTKIKPFCKKSMHPFKYNDHTINYKFIILDEADTLTPDAQNALRRCIEMYSYNTRFCFLCNYISNIVSPIISRCFTHQFKRIAKESAIKRLQYIIQNENMKHLTSDYISQLYDGCRGDMRLCISSLEQIYTFKNSSLENTIFLKEITNDNYQQYWNVNISYTLFEHVALLRNTGISCRLLMKQFIKWMLLNLKAEQIYEMYLDLSCIEKKLLHITTTEPILYKLTYLFSKYR